MKLRDHLRQLWRWWESQARKLANIIAWLFLLLFYFLILPPFAFVVKGFSDPLRLKGSLSSGWITRTERHVDPWVQAHKQF
ncbi:MAG: hypothetical protein HY694_06670 [Deltaproteobacteria bacterium]|nr:hypothetical protein [Deltaproteobacteria bacterium]